MMQRSRAWLWIVLAVAAGCRKEPVQLDRVTLEQSLAARATAGAMRPGVGDAVEQAIEAVAADPALQRKGEAMFAALAADPKVSAAATELLDAVQADPAVLDAIRELVVKHPDVGLDQIEGFVGERVSSSFDLPEVSSVFDAFGNELMRRVDFGKPLGAVSSRIARSITSADEERWSKRLIDLAGGERPDPRRAAELYVEHAWEPARIEKAVVALLGNPTVRRESAAVVTEVLSLAPVTAEIRGSVVTLTADPNMRALVVQLFARTMAEPRDNAAVAAAVRTLIMSPPVLEATRRVLDRVIASPEAATRASAALDAIARDPAVRTTTDELMHGW